MIEYNQIHKAIVYKHAMFINIECFALITYETNNVDMLIDI